MTSSVRSLWELNLGEQRRVHIHGLDSQRLHDGRQRAGTRLNEGVKGRARLISAIGSPGPRAPSTIPSTRAFHKLLVCSQALAALFCPE